MAYPSRAWYEHEELCEHIASELFRDDPARFSAMPCDVFDSLVESIAQQSELR